MKVAAGTIANPDQVRDGSALPWDVVDVTPGGPGVVVLQLRNAAGCAADWRLGVTDEVDKV